MKILGISAFYHDSAAVLIQDGEILAATQEERFTRKKHDSSFPKNAVRYALESSNLGLDQLDAIVFYDKPFLKFERLLETYCAFAPRGLSSFLIAMPVWLKDKIFLKKLIQDELKGFQSKRLRQPKLLFSEHHLSHAASTFFVSPYPESAILTLDGVGEWATASFCYGDKNQIKILKELHFPHSLGMLYSAFTYYIGFKVNSGEYKLMGLAPYGNRNSESVKKYIDLIKTHLMDLKLDGSIWLNQKYFNYCAGLEMVHENAFEELFGFSRRKSEERIEQVHCDLALAIQQVTEEVVLLMAQELKRLTGSNNLCMAGGVALNCVANGKLLEQKIFSNLFIQPAAGDAGGALGAALAAEYLYFGQSRQMKSKMDSMQGSYLGPEFLELDIQCCIKKYNASARKCADFSELVHKVSQLIVDGNIIGWFQGRMEFGPRALGNRSILADPRNMEMQRKLNLKIKYREDFRPFAPAVLAEDAGQYFELFETDSPYMLLVAPLKKNRRKTLPENYHELSMREKLYYMRSDLPAVTHIDFSARVQTVHRHTNEKLWNLIHAFKGLTGYGVLLNTSFNVRGEPIVCTPEQAYQCFMRTQMDYLVIENYLFSKKDQSSWNEQDDWKKEFVLD